MAPKDRYVEVDKGFDIAGNFDFWVHVNKFDSYPGDSD